MKGWNQAPPGAGVGSQLLRSGVWLAPFRNSSQFEDDARRGFSAGREFVADDAGAEQLFDHLVLH